MSPSLQDTLVLDVPFIKNSGLACGAVCLQIVCSYFGLKHSLEKLKALVDPEQSGCTWTIGIAKGAAESGLNVEFLSGSLDLDTSNFDLEYYQKYSEGIASAEERLKYLIAACKKLGVELQEKTLGLDQLLARINKTCIPVVLVDYSKIVNKDSFIGHFLPLVGYDYDNVIVHQVGPTDAKAYLKIDKELFDRARTAKGTDQDIVFISKKGSLGDVKEYTTKKILNASSEPS